MSKKISDINRLNEAVSLNYQFYMMDVSEWVCIKLTGQMNQQIKICCFGVMVK